MTEKHILLAVIFIVHAQKYVMIAEIVYIYIKNIIQREFLMKLQIQVLLKYIQKLRRKREDWD